MFQMRRIRWRKGGGELIGFALIMPTIMLVFCALIMAAQLGIARQSIEYTTYSACRAAVICESKEQAQLAAEKIVRETIYGIPGVRDGSAQVKINSFTGTPLGKRWTCELRCNGPD